MKSWALCLAALGLVWGGMTLGEAHIMTPDFVREANKESIATHEKELQNQDEIRRDEVLRQQLRTKKKELEENERLEKKAMKNMSEDKLKELNREKREAEKRAEMKSLLELKRLEKKFMLKSESGFSTELKSAKKQEKKSHLMMKQLKKDKSLKHLLKKELKESKSLKASKAKHLKKSASDKDEKKKHVKSVTGKIKKKQPADETILKHAPEYMKLGRNVEEKRALKKLRMRMKRAAEVFPSATATKAFLSMPSAGKLSKYSEEDQDYWSNEQNRILKDAGDYPAPEYNEVEGGDGNYYLDGGAQDEPTLVTSSPEINELEEEVISEDLLLPDLLLSATPDVAANEIAPVTEAVQPDYIPTSSAALIGGSFTQPPVQITTFSPIATPDVAENEIIPATETDQSGLFQTPSSAPVEETFTQPPVVITTGLPSWQVPTARLPSFEAVSSEATLQDLPTSPPLPATSSQPVVSTAEPVTANSASENLSADLGAPANSSDNPSMSYVEPAGLNNPNWLIVTLAPEGSVTSSAPLLATSTPVETTTPSPSPTLDESYSTTTPPPTTTEFSGPWPWQNVGPEQESQCGQARFGPESRVDRGQRRTLKILNGKEALPGSFPWQVAILDKDRDMLCGGTLIAPRWVMTAAHCIRKKLFVRLSEHHIHNKDGYEIEQKVRRIFRHPGFNSSTIDNDIALLRLPALPPFFDSVSGVARVGVTDRACLPDGLEDLPPVGTRCLVMGWGKASTSHSYGTDVLMYTRLPIISRKACIRANRKTITENMFCAGHYKGGSDTCSGDSGGPLLCSTGGAPSEETWTVYGVTSFGDGCGNAGKMGVYAKVNNYLSWMAGIMSRYQ